MALSSLYTTNTSTYYLTNESGNFASFVGSQKLDNLYTGGSTFDTSCYYTMCTDNECNKVYKVTTDMSKDKFKINTKTITGEHNGIINVLRNTTNTSAGILKGNERLQINNGVAARSPYGINNQFDMSTHFIMPWIYALDKEDCKESVFYTQSVYDNSKIKRITLQELYNNKDKYYIVSFITELRVWLTNNYSYYANNPVRVVKYNDNYIGRSPAAYNGNNVFIPTSGVAEPNGFWRRYTNSAISGVEWSFNFGNTDITDNSDSLVFCDYGNIDVTFTFDNQFEKKETTTGIWHLKSWTDTNGTQYKSGLFTYDVEYVLRCFAESGLYIAWTNTRPSKPVALSGNVAIGEMNDNGFTTGKIIPPSQLDDYKGLNKTLTDVYTLDIDTGKYKPVTPDGDDVTEPDYRITDQIGGFTMYYKVSQSDLLTIVQRVNFPDSQFPIPEGWEFAPHLVSCTQYPFNVSQYAGGNSSNVIIGSWDSGVNSIALTSSQLAVQTIADFTIEHKFNSFLDYSPYAQYQLYIPLCGWVDIPDNAVGKNITVELATDVINNSCVATVKADGCPIVSKVGHMGSSVAISVTENGLKQSALTQSLFNTVGAITSTGYAIATQNAIGIVNGVASVAGAIAQGNIANNSNYTRQIGATSDKSDFHVSNSCYLKISYAQPDEPDTYAHSVGYPCNKSGNIESFSGYTVCSDVDTNGLSCNQNHKDMIKRILETGFYI